MDTISTIANPEKAALLDQLTADYGALDNLVLLDSMINHQFKDKIALVSSFGAESVVLLDLVAEVAPHTPIIFLNTRKLFGETIKYRDTLAERLGLTNIIEIKPDEEELKAEDHNGLLWTRDTDACCDVRKVRPLGRTLSGYEAWITGRKRFQSSTRSNISLIELDGSQFKINPLAYWSQEELDSRMSDRDLPPHPLVEEGYPSIGCMPCTVRVEVGQDRRSGRWQGLEKTECGIHIAENI